MQRKVSQILETPIEFLKGVGPMRAVLLQKELQVFTWNDLLFSFPFRYVDKTVFHRIKDIRSEGMIVQLRGRIVSIEKIAGKRSSRLSVLFKDESGFIELLWFKGVKWMSESLKEGKDYLAYGKVNIYKGKKSIAHPEVEEMNAETSLKNKTFEPVYNSTEKLETRGITNRIRRALIVELFKKITAHHIPDNLPQELLTKLKLCSRFDALKWIHFPPSESQKDLAINRFKFEELFYLQLRILYGKQIRSQKLIGANFEKVGKNFNRFFNEKLTFELTGAQKRVLKEIRYDVGTGIQMNRLIQGDVGSGKTIVALMSMLLALDNGYQACMMAPTEILAQQHFESITSDLKGLKIRVAFLSGSIKGRQRKQLLDLLSKGEIDILIGTHALIEDPVIFGNLGLAIIDEQHRFGVVQRARLWKKNKKVAPHILVMTATPIPRTLAMTVYGDLDVSVIDELPPGRKDVKTIHRTEAHRPAVLEFMHKEIAKGRQIYVVYPLIEESEKLDLQNLQQGYDFLLQYFPLPDYRMSIVHGRMKPAVKDMEMKRFVDGRTQIMVATTVIEVGVNVQNASVMIIENTERFGLSQLHQLRGRVGRGAEQSFCVLMSSYKLTKEAKERIQTMVSTNDGFKIAEVDMRLRGPGDIQGTRQSGTIEFKLANLVLDQHILYVARHSVQEILKVDPTLKLPINLPIRTYMTLLRAKFKDWGRIS